MDDAFVLAIALAVIEVAEERGVTIETVVDSIVAAHPSGNDAAWQRRARELQAQLEERDLVILQRDAGAR
jgi:hypothetical protein